MPDDAFDELMARLDHGMLVVTTVSGGAKAGCLVGFHGQCSIEPPGYAVWLSKANHTYRVGMLADIFAVHLLQQGDEDVAALFGTTTGDVDDKFAHTPFSLGPDGVPLLDRCPNRFVGRRRGVFDGGTDHVCIVVEPLTADASDSFAPLLFSAVSHLEAAHDAEERQRGE